MKMLMSHRIVVALVALATLGQAHLPAQRTQPIELPATFTAFAVSTGGAQTSAVASQVEFTINRWSTTSESERLLAVLKDKGAERLIEALRDVKSVGTIKTPGNLAYDLRFAYSEPGEDGGTRIVLATDRPVSYWEAVNRPRVSDYPFTFIELRLNKDGDGVGKLALATKLAASKDGKTIVLENYDAEPIALNKVTRRPR